MRTLSHYEVLSIIRRTLSINVRLYICTSGGGGCGRTVGRAMMPRHYVRFFWMALTLGLDCPAGRALYACNRKAMGGLPLTGADMELRIERVLRRARTSTAERWLQHWRKGGTIYHSTRSLKDVRAGWKKRSRAWRKTR